MRLPPLRYSDDGERWYDADMARCQLQLRHIDVEVFAETVARCMDLLDGRVFQAQSGQYWRQKP